MVYIFGGEGKTGCSAIATTFRDNVGADYIYGGQIMREQAVAHGFTKVNPLTGEIVGDIDRFRKFCADTKSEVDYLVDTTLLQKMLGSLESGKALVVESKIMARLLLTQACGELLKSINSPLSAAELREQTRSSWIYADPETRARRALKLPDTAPDSPLLQETMNGLTLRQSSDRKVYWELYGIDNYPEPGTPPDASFGRVFLNGRGVSLEHTLAKVTEYMLAPDTTQMTGPTVLPSVTTEA